MSFQSPWFLLSLAVLAAAVGIWLLAERRRMRYAVHFPNVDVLATVVSGRSWLRLVPPLLVGLALALLLAALARPHVTRMFLNEKATVILVVDTSRSMQAEDVAPTRLGAAQEAIRTFVDDVPDRLNLGLVVFAGDTQVATPPTKNRALLLDAVDTIDSFSVFGGTAIGDALDTAVDLGKRVSEDETRSGEIALGERRQFAAVGQTRHLAQAESCEEDGPVSILFLSDGAQTRGILQPLEGAALARDACIPGVHDRARDAGGHHRSRDARWRLPGRHRAALHPCPTRSRDAPRDRGHDRRRVLGGAVGRLAGARVLEPRLAARAGAGRERGHVPLRRARGRAARGRRLRGDVRGPALAVIVP